MNNKLNKTIYLGLVAQRVLTKQEYKRLTAKAIAASFPLLSISPYNKSTTFISSPTLR